MNTRRYKSFRFSFPTILDYTDDVYQSLKINLVEHNVKRLLFIYGNKSIKVNSVYLKLKILLDELRIFYFEIGGLEKNPTDVLLQELLSNLSPLKYDFILAVGGGTVIDTAKAISYFSVLDSKNDIWNKLNEPFSYNVRPVKVGVINTFPSSGSDSNGSFVITNKYTGERIGRNHLLTKPVFTIIDRKFLKSLSRRQINQGLIEIISHLFEQFFALEEVSLSDHMIANLLAYLIKKVLSNSEKVFYDLYEELFFSSTFAQSYVFQAGRTTDWVSHSIEYNLSGKLNTIHSDGIGIIMPKWIEFSENNINYNLRLDLLRQSLNLESISDLISLINDVYGKLRTSNTIQELTNNLVTIANYGNFFEFSGVLGKVNILDKNSQRDFVLTLFKEL